MRTIPHFRKKADPKRFPTSNPKTENRQAKTENQSSAVGGAMATPAHGAPLAVCTFLTPLVILYSHFGCS
jgi:hypothetical protein